MQSGDRESAAPPDSSLDDEVVVTDVDTDVDMESDSVFDSRSPRQRDISQAISQADTLGTFGKRASQASLFSSHSGPTRFSQDPSPPPPPHSISPDTFKPLPGSRPVSELTLQQHDISSVSGAAGGTSRRVKDRNSSQRLSVGSRGSRDLSRPTSLHALPSTASLSAQQSETAPPPPPSLLPNLRALQTDRIALAPVAASDSSSPPKQGSELVETDNTAGQHSASPSLSREEELRTESPIRTGMGERGGGAYLIKGERPRSMDGTASGLRSPARNLTLDSPQRRLVPLHLDPEQTLSRPPTGRERDDVPLTPLSPRRTSRSFKEGEVPVFGQLAPIGPSSMDDRIRTESLPSAVPRERPRSVEWSSSKRPLSGDFSSVAMHRTNTPPLFTRRVPSRLSFAEAPSLTRSRSPPSTAMASPYLPLSQLSKSEVDVPGKNGRPTERPSFLDTDPVAQGSTHPFDNLRGKGSGLTRSASQGPQSRARVSVTTRPRPLSFAGEVQYASGSPVVLQDDDILLKRSLESDWARRNASLSMNARGSASGEFEMSAYGDSNPYASVSRHASISTLLTARARTAAHYHANTLSALRPHFPPHPARTLAILSYDSVGARIAHLTLPLRTFAHIPLAIALDYNAVSLLVQLASKRPDEANSGGAVGWYIALALYATSFVIWLFGIVGFRELGSWLMHDRKLANADVQSVYLSATSHSFAAMSSYSIYSFLTRIRLSATTNDFLTETCWFYSQNWPTVLTAVPRGIICSIVLILYSPYQTLSDGPVPARDVTYFVPTTGVLSTFAFVILLINAAWAFWRLLLVSLASFGLVVLLGFRNAWDSSIQYEDEESEFDDQYERRHRAAMSTSTIGGGSGHGRFASQSSRGSLSAMSAWSMRLQDRIRRYLFSAYPRAPSALGRSESTRTRTGQMLPDDLNANLTTPARWTASVQGSPRPRTAVTGLTSVTLVDSDLRRAELVGDGVFSEAEILRRSPKYSGRKLSMRSNRSSSNAHLASLSPSRSKAPQLPMLGGADEETIQLADSATGQLYDPDTPTRPSHGRRNVSFGPNGSPRPQTSHSSMEAAVLAAAAVPTPTTISPPGDGYVDVPDTFEAGISGGTLNPLVPDTPTTPSRLRPYPTTSRTSFDTAPLPSSTGGITTSGLGLDSADGLRPLPGGFPFPGGSSRNSSRPASTPTSVVVSSPPPAPRSMARSESQDARPPGRSSITISEPRSRPLSLEAENLEELAPHGKGKESGGSGQWLSALMTSLRGTGPSSSSSPSSATSDLPRVGTATSSSNNLRASSGESSRTPLQSSQNLGVMGGGLLAGQSPAGSSNGHSQHSSDRRSLTPKRTPIADLPPLQTSNPVTPPRTSPRPNFVPISTTAAESDSLLGAIPSPAPSDESAETDDSEERRLWASFPNQSRIHPPGLIALNLNLEREERQRERERQKAANANMTSGLGLEGMHADALPINGSGATDTVLLPAVSSPGLLSPGSGADGLSISPSERGLGPIREESTSTHSQSGSGGSRAGSGSKRGSL